MTEEKKRGGCMKLAGIGAAVLGGLVVIGALAGPDSKTAAPADASTEVGEPAALAVTARELHAAFDANEVAAKAKFGGQRLAVSGTIAGVQLDVLDNPVVLLETGNEFQSVQATFGKDVADRIGTLAKGQEITVTCGEVSEVIGTPILGECALP